MTSLQNHQGQRGNETLSDQIRTGDGRLQQKMALKNPRADEFPVFFLSTSNVPTLIEPNPASSFPLECCMSASDCKFRQAAPSFEPSSAFRFSGLHCQRTSRSHRPSINQSRASAAQTWPTQNFTTHEHPREYSQLRRVGHKQQANDKRSVALYAEDARRSSRKAK